MHAVPYQVFFNHLGTTVISYHKEKIDLTQGVMNDMIRDLDLPKDKAELLSSRLTDLGLGELKHIL